MKWSLYVTGDALQINLEPEGANEEELTGLLNKYAGSAVVHKGVSIKECVGGYIRSYGEQDKHVAITIRKPIPNHRIGEEC